MVHPFLVKDDGLGPRVQNQIHVLFLQDGFALEHHFSPLNGHNLTGVFFHEILDPRLQNTGRQRTTKHALQACFGHLNFVGKVKNAKDVSVRFVADAAEQRGHGQFLLPVDVRVHHTVDVRRKFNPRSLEWDDSRRVQFGSIGVTALAEEHTWRTVQLIDNHTLCAIHHKRPLRSHVGNGAQIHVLNDGLKILVLGVRAIQLQLRLQRHAVRQAALNAFLNAVAWGIDEVIEEFENELISGVCDGEVFTKHLEQSLRCAVFRVRFQLEKLLK